MNTSSFTIARRNMVLSQINTNKVIDPRLLAALEQLPREWFVPDAALPLAYGDVDVPLGNGRYLLEPMVLARLLQAAAIHPNDHVLDLAPASGYSTALFALLAGSVVAVEPDAGLRQLAKANLQQLQEDFQLAPVTWLAKDQGVGGGAPEQGPYDIMLLNGATASLPSAYAAQLKLGGRLLCICRGADDAVAKATLYTKHHNHLDHLPLFDCATPWLPELSPPPAFVF
jgi:protein-L-isoaspartate(D-aspartate) O-methyltransferase